MLRGLLLPSHGSRKQRYVEQNLLVGLGGEELAELFNLT